MPENTYNVNNGSTWMRMPSRENAEGFLSTVKARRQEAENNTRQQQQNERINNVVNLQSHWASATNEEIKKCYDKACRVEEVAWMFSAFDWSTWNYKDVINWFLLKHDGQDRSMYNAAFDYIQRWSGTIDDVKAATIWRVEDPSYTNYTYTPFWNTDVQYEEQSMYSPFGDAPTMEQADKDQWEAVAIDRWGREYKWNYANDEWNFWGDVLWAIPWTVQNIGGLLESRIDKWLNKVWLMSDERLDAEENLRDVARVENYVPWINENDFTYQAAQFLDELGAWIWMDIASWWGLTPELIASKRPVAQKLLSFISKNKWAKNWLNLVKKGLGWMKDMFVLNTLEWEDTELSDLWWGALFNILLWRAFNKEKADKRTLKWLINSWPLGELVKMLKEKGVDISGEAIGEFVNKRFKWTKEQIAKQATKWAESAEKVLDALLSSVDTKFNSETTTNVLKLIAEDIEAKISAEWDKVADEVYQAKADVIRSLIRDWDNYTLSEIKNAMRTLTDSEMNPFTKKFKELKWKDLSKTVGGWYTELKDFLEKKGTELWLWDIKNLNREIYTSYELARGVMKKDFAEQLSNSMKDTISDGISWWLRGAIAGFLTWNTTKWAFIWAIVNLWQKWWKQLLKNTAFKTKFADLVYKVNWIEKQAILDWVDSEWKKKLSEGASEEVKKLLEKTDKGFWEQIMPNVYNDVFRNVAQETAQWLSDASEWFSVDIGE